MVRYLLRFVDDMSLFLPEENKELTLNSVNAFHSRIKLLPQNNNIKFLELSITYNNFKFSTY